MKMSLVVKAAPSLRQRFQTPVYLGLPLRVLCARLLVRSDPKPYGGQRLLVEPQVSFGSAFEDQFREKLSGTIFAMCGMGSSESNHKYTRQKIVSIRIRETRELRRERDSAA